MNGTFRAERSVAASLVPSVDQLRVRLHAELRVRRPRDFVSLTKPRVVALIVFTAVIGMLLAPGPILLTQAVFGAIGIALMAASAAAANCLFEAKRDAAMARTRGRPLA